MLDNEYIVKIKNRKNGSLGYKIPDTSFHRHFEPGEVKEVTFGELKQISYSKGGKYILEHYLLINDKDAAEELLGTVEPEYYYTDETIEKLLLHGSVDELLDCLDFAPSGVISILKQKAVDLEIVDMNKRMAIMEKTGLDVTKAIANKEEETEEVAAPKRRTAPVSNPETKKRRTAKAKTNVEEAAE